MTDFYVYVHTRNDTGEVFYVGKGKGKRHLAHDNRNEWWTKIVTKRGFTASILERFCDEADAFAMERYLIASYRGIGMTLCNQTAGGDGVAGYHHTNETKAALSAKLKELRKGTPMPVACLEMAAKANKTRVFSEQEKENRHKGMLGNTNGKAHKGRKLPEETKAKMKASWFRTPEARERTRLGSLGKKYSAERVAKAQAAKAGWTHSEESKARIGAASKAYWAAKKAAAIIHTD